MLNAIETKIPIAAGYREELSQLWDSNPRPSRYECDALPTKLNWQRNSFIKGQQI